MASHIETILNATTNVCVAAGLGNVPVVRRLRPKIFEGDPNPIVLVSERSSKGWRKLTFAGHREQIHTVQVTLIAAGNQDDLTDKDRYAGWQQLLRTALFGVVDELDGAPDVVQIELLDDDAFDVAALIGPGYFHWHATVQYHVIPQVP